jgi:ribosomal protein L1
MMLETYSKKASENSEEVRKQIEELLKYMDSSIKNLVMLTGLMGTVEFSKEELNNNILSIFKEYSQSHKVTIDYKVSGQKDL